MYTGVVLHALCVITSCGLGDLTGEWEMLEMSYSVQVVYQLLPLHKCANCLHVQVYAAGFMDVAAAEEHASWGKRCCRE